MQPDSEKTKILLIEDNDIDVELVRRIVRRNSLDLPIVHARNGIEALEILKAPDAEGLIIPYVILLDINMPLMDGFELLEHLSNYGPAVDMPIFILSTSASEEDQQKMASYSISGYMVKPLTIDKLTEVLSIST